jgi:hypothetical protein
MEKKDIETVEETKIYVGLIYREDGWYKFFTDGNKNYTFEKVVNQD